MECYIQDRNIDTDSAIIHHKENIDLLPTNLDLSAMEISLVTAMSREYTIKNCLSSIKDKYDYILIDCMPSLGMIIINALVSADKVIIPVQTQFLAAKGMGHLLKTVAKVKRSINPNLKIGGTLLTLVDKRTKLSKETKQLLEENYGNIVKIYNTQIPSAVKVAESTSSGKSVFSYDKNSKVTSAYKEFGKEILTDGKEYTKSSITQSLTR